MQIIFNHIDPSDPEYMDYDIVTDFTSIQEVLRALELPECEWESVTNEIMDDLAETGNAYLGHYAIYI